jgi:predicted nucleic acid-binding protein
MADTAIIKVVDASALAALVFDEPAGDQVAQLTDDCELVAPLLLRFEMANVCWVKMRRKPEEQAALLAALRMPGIVVETLGVDHHAVVELASQTGLTTYDASYLWLARDLAVELVTLDRQLAEAAEKFQ